MTPIEMIEALEKRIMARLENIDIHIGRIFTAIGDFVPDRDPALMAVLEEHRAAIEELTTLVKGRNKSAAVKRNMTDEDAVRCATGDAAKLDHKDAAELLGLTYAQVYSFRLEYTFKHIHKRLTNEGWKNPWAKNTTGVHRIQK